MKIDIPWLWTKSLIFQILRDGYTEEFYELPARNVINKNPIHMVSRYVNSLKQLIQDYVEMFEVLNVENGYRYALKLKHNKNNLVRKVGLE